MGYVIGVTCPFAVEEPAHIVPGPGTRQSGDAIVTNEEVEIDLSDPEAARSFGSGVYDVTCPVCGRTFGVQA